MTKFFSLIAAVLMAGTMMAVTLDPATQTPQTTETDINLTIEGIGVAYHGTLNAAYESYPADFRVYASNTLTLTASSAISKVVIAGKANKTGFTATVDHGTITTGASYEAITEKTTLSDPLIVVENINSMSVALTVGKQLRAYKIEVVLDGEGGEGGEQGDEIVLDVAYAEAAYVTDAENGNYWQFNLYKDWDGANVTYPDLYIGVEPKSTTAIAGTYSVASEELFFVELDTDASTTVEATEASDLVVTHMGNGVYRYQMSFVGDDGKTYVLDKQLATEAYDYDTEADITLIEDGGTPVSEDLATEGVHTLVPVETDAAGKGAFNIVMDGIQLVWEGAYYATDFRVYATNTMTITAGANISKVEIAGLAKKDQEITVNHGTITVGGSYAEETTKDDIEDPLLKIENIGATSVTLSCTKQLQAKIIRVTVDGGQGVAEVMAAGKAAKIVRDGRVLIMKGDKIFNMHGQRVQ